MKKTKRLFSGVLCAVMIGMMGASHAEQHLPASVAMKPMMLQTFGPVAVRADDRAVSDGCVIPGGMPFGIKMFTDGVFANKGPMAHGIVNHLGTTVLLVIGGVEVIVTCTRFQPWDLEIYYSHGINPAERKILVTKSYAHYRAHYGTIATNMVNVELPGLTAKDPRSFVYKNLVHPVYPYDFPVEEN